MRPLNPRVQAVVPGEGHRLILTFTNGEVGIFDCSHLLTFGMFEVLSDLRYFRRVRAQLGTVVWPHEQDICPDTLYLDSMKVDPAHIDPMPAH